MESYVGKLNFVPKHVHLDAACNNIKVFVHLLYLPFNICLCLFTKFLIKQANVKLILFVTYKQKREQKHVP